MPSVSARSVFLAIAWTIARDNAWADASQTLPPIACVPTQNGICEVPDSDDFHFRPELKDWVLVMNFGLVTATSSSPRTKLACEEAYGRKTPERVLVDRLGWIHVPGASGIVRARTDATCTWLSATGIPQGALVQSLSEGANAPQTIWALVLNGAVASIYRSIDGGVNYQMLSALPANTSYFRIDAAPGDPATVYVTGIGTDGSPVLVRTHDNGVSFETLAPIPAFPEPKRFLSLLAIAPDDPKRIFFSRSTPEGEDEIWRTDDAGATAKPVLRMRDGEVVTGFTFGASPNVVFAAGTPLLTREAGVTARLYVSRDLGSTWDEPIPSAQNGPRYRCLKYRGNVLYACGAGETQQDPFLLGQSVDDGRTWTPVVTVATLPPPARCMADLCPETATWLCEKYAVCDTEPAEGCNCRIGKPPRRGVPGLGVMIFLTTMWIFRSRRRRGQNF